MSRHGRSKKRSRTRKYLTILTILALIITCSLAIWYFRRNTHAVKTKSLKTKSVSKPSLKTEQEQEKFVNESSNLVPLNISPSQSSTFIQSQPSPIDSDCSPLIALFKAGREDEVTRYFLQEVDLFAIEKSTGRTAFHYLAMSCRADVWIYLPQNLADNKKLLDTIFFHQDRDGNTPIHLALKHQHAFHAEIQMYAIRWIYSNESAFHIKNKAKETAWTLAINKWRSVLLEQIICGKYFKSYANELLDLRRRHQK